MADDLHIHCHYMSEYRNSDHFPAIITLDNLRLKKTNYHPKTQTKWDISSFTTSNIKKYKQLVAKGCKQLDASIQHDIRKYDLDTNSETFISALLGSIQKIIKKAARMSFKQITQRLDVPFR
eukprot:850085_1